MSIKSKVVLGTQYPNTIKYDKLVPGVAYRVSNSSNPQFIGSIICRPQGFENGKILILHNNVLNGYCPLNATVDTEVAEYVEMKNCVLTIEGSY